MKNPEINIIRKLGPEQKKLLFYAPIGIIIFAICGYVLFNDNKTDKKEPNTTATTKWELPSDSEKNLPSSSLKIEDELDQYNNKIAGNNNSDFFNDLNNVDSSKEVVTGDEPNNKDAMYLKIQEQLKSLENKKTTTSTISKPTGYKSGSNGGEKKQLQEDSEMEDYKRLMEMKELQLNNNQDYSKTVVSESNGNNSTMGNINTRAAIYKNQFVLPGDRVKLILTQDVVINGNLFEKNTPVYAMVNINRSRVLLDIKNINGVPVNLVARDIQDQLVGLYNKRAGELWNQYEDEQNKTAVDGITSEIDTGSGFLNSSIKSIGNFFKKRKVKDGDKILLINDHEIILSSNN